MNAIPQHADLIDDFWKWFQKNETPLDGIISMTVSANGNREIFKEVEEIVEKAPVIPLLDLPEFIDEYFPSRKPPGK